MTYKEELRQMSNEELLSDLRFNKEYKLYKKRKDVETELLFRLKRDPMSENCGNCRYLTFGTSEQGKNVWNCRNKEPLISNFWNFRTSSYDVYVNKTIRCSLWEGGDK